MPIGLVPSSAAYTEIHATVVTRVRAIGILLHYESSGAAAARDSRSRRRRYSCQLGVLRSSLSQPSLRIHCSCSISCVSFCSSTPAQPPHPPKKALQLLQLLIDQLYQLMLVHACASHTNLSCSCSITQISFCSSRPVHPPWGTCMLF